ncbi:hypothetical protein ACFVYT_42185 [Streptomyces sp. NPDC058290]|uniref:hypothetical protein n=1 Tax=unclassified Streptomyces TaxID=2593676 RepID=UPI0036ED5FA2
MEDERPSGAQEKLTRRLAWWVGVLAGLAGVAGLILSAFSWDDFTVEEWTREANAVCDDQAGPVLESYRLVQELLPKVNPAGLANENDRAAATALESLGANQRKLSGGIGKIQLPNSNKETINSMLEALNDASDEDYALAEDLRSDVFSSKRYAEYAKLRNEFAKQVIDAWTKLKLTHCLPGE